MSRRAENLISGRSLPGLLCWMPFVGIVGCGTSSSLGGEEPLRVLGAQFVEGDLPFGDREEDADLPAITSPVASTLLLRERLAGINFSGTTSDTAVAVGVRVEDFGSGYWLFPTGGRDAQAPNALLYDFTADLMAALPAGPRTLVAVAFDERGRPGPPTRSTLCVQSLRPDNGNACVPERAPPALVISLEWDSAVDLDLILVAPDERVLSAKQPGLAAANPGEPPLGRLVQDGNADCHIDGLQREDIVFENLPPPGKYALYASLAKACGEPSVRYQASFAARVREGDSSYAVRVVDLGGGGLAAAQVNLSGGLGTFIDEVDVK